MNGIKALTFDTGGTVLDWHTGITRALGQAGQRHGLELEWPAIANEYRRWSLRRMVGSVSPPLGCMQNKAVARINGVGLNAARRRERAREEERLLPIEPRAFWHHPPMPR